MDFKFFCPDCNQKMIMGDEFFGYPIECPHCKSKLTLLPDGPIEPVDKPKTPVAPAPVPQNNTQDNYVREYTEYRFLTIDINAVNDVLNDLVKDGWQVVSQSTVNTVIQKTGLIKPANVEAIAYTLGRKKI